VRPDLEEAGDAPTDVLGRALGDVGGREGVDAANSDAGEDSARMNESETVRAAVAHGREDLEEGTGIRRGIGTVTGRI
jgi:hypothetical protein